MFIRFLVFLALLSTLAWQPAAAQQPGAELDRSRIAEGETITLTLSVPGDLDGEPDLTPLAGEFDILDRSQSSHTSIINGRMDSRRVWQLVLAPKRVGSLQVPALQVGTGRTQPLSLQVLPAGSKAAGNDSPKLFVEVEITPQSPYVQQQVIYIVRIFSRVTLRKAGLSEPEVEGALLERMGEDRAYRLQRDGHHYQIIERRYALYPQRSGRLSIAGPVLSATVPVEKRRRRGMNDRFFGRDPFDNFPGMGNLFQETRTMRVRGKDLELEVQPQPAGLSGPWLPAQNLTLQQSWTPEPAQFRVGEPVTRTLTLRARGLTASQLPDLEPPAVPGLKVYPDRPQTRSEAVNGGIEAVKEIKAALVPSRAGRFQLPEIRLAWWDTLAGREQTEVIPALDIEVLPAANGTAAASPPPMPATVLPAEEEAAADPAPLTAVSPSTTGAAGYWPWVAAALGVAWLLTLALWLQERRRGRSRKAEPAQLSKAAPSPSLREIERTFRAGDPRAARQALLAWATARWPQRPPKGLDSLARRLDSVPATAALQALDQALYAPGSSPWEGAAAWRNLAPALKGGDRKRETKGKTALPELYPESG